MLALNGGRFPLVNPAAFHHGGDSIWLTTSRHAVKVALARKQPLSSFLVDGGSRCVLLEGEAEVYVPPPVPRGGPSALAGTHRSLRQAAAPALNSAAATGS